MNGLCPVKKVFNTLSRHLDSRLSSNIDFEQGVRSLFELVDDVCKGRAKEDHMELIQSLSSWLLDEAPNKASIELAQMVDTILSENTEAFRSHVEAHYCPTGECSTLSPAPCQLACPANVDAPSYVALVGMGKYREALEVLREDIPIPGCLGRVCVHPCERACRRGKVDDPIAICDLKRVAFDKAYEQGLMPPPSPPQRYENKVAVIGSGPAGLSAGYFLAKKGYTTVIFESMPEPGGMLRWGIPSYRLPRHILRTEIDYIKAIGVEIHTNVNFGQDITVDMLKDKGFDAIFLGLGTCCSIKLPIEGSQDNPNVIEGLTFLRHEHLRQSMVGRRVIVIGGGNAAIDCVRTALRLDVDVVQLVYRRSRKEMPARTEEVRAAEQEGAVLKFLSSPLRVHAENGKLTGLECIQNKLSEPDATGRRRPLPIEGSEFILPADTIISAIGQEVDELSLESLPEMDLTKNNLVAVNPETMETSMAGVFAGGDVVSGPATVVEAVAAGKKAADSIHRYLRGIPWSIYKLLPARRKRVPVMEILTEEKSASVRPEVPAIDIRDRRGNFSEVELGLSEADASAEAKRCLRCDICISCGRCIEVCRDEIGVDAIHLSYVNENSTEDTDLSRPAQRCIGCTSCAVNCPTGAITVEEKNGHRSLRMCGAEMSRHQMVPCTLCGRHFVTERHLDYIREKTNGQIGVKFNQDICPDCARKTAAENLTTPLFLY